TDVVMELGRLCFEVTREFRHSVFFAGQLVFGDDLNGFMSRFLHNHTALDLLQSLQMHGMSRGSLPVRVAPTRAPDAVPDAVPEALPACPRTPPTRGTLSRARLSRSQTWNLHRQHG